MCGSNFFLICWPDKYSCPPKSGSMLAVILLQLSPIGTQDLFFSCLTFYHKNSQHSYNLVANHQITNIAIGCYLLVGMCVIFWCNLLESLTRNTGIYFQNHALLLGGGGLLKTGSLFMLAVSFRLSARLSCVTAKLQTTDYVRIKFFGYQLKVSQRRHACGCWLTSNIQYMAHIDYTILYKYIYM